MKNKVIFIYTMFLGLSAFATNQEGQWNENCRQAAGKAMEIYDKIIKKEEFPDLKLFDKRIYSCKKKSAMKENPSVCLAYREDIHDIPSYSIRFICTA